MSKLAETATQDANRAETGFDVVEEPTFDKIDEISEFQHALALAILEVEQILSEKVDFSDYPTTVLPEIKLLRSRAEAIIAGLPDDSNSLRLKRTVENAIMEYLGKKVEVKRAEIQMRRYFEMRGFDFNEETVGNYLFSLRTAKEPQSLVTAKRHDAFWVIEFSDDNDRLQFRAGERSIEDVKASGGSYHSSLKIGRLTIDVLAIPLGETEFEGGTYLHERQHFLNHEIFTLFADIESDDYMSKILDIPLLEKAIRKYPQIKKDLRRIKDEVIAYVRDVSFDVNFLENDLYSHLLKPFSPDERKELELLMREIDKLFGEVQNYFPEPLSRAILVYHLLDAPLTRFPERLIAIRDFCTQRCQAIEHLVPQDSLTIEQCGNSEDLYYDVTGLAQLIWHEAVQAYPFVWGVLDGKNGLSKQILKITLLRAEYDKLAQSVLAA